jgi:8-oxo-dGTP pyrophosphatase MutT (NUDIX family)
MNNFAGIIFTDGKNVLLVRRIEGTWDIPGGKIKPGENPLSAAKRESEEEVGTAKGKKLYEFQKPYVYIFKVDNMFDVVLSNEHDKWKWVKLHKVEKYDLHPEFKNNWKEYYKKIKEFTVPSSFKEWIKMEAYGYCRIKLYK